MEAKLRYISYCSHVHGHPVIACVGHDLAESQTHFLEGVGSCRFFGSVPLTYAEKKFWLVTFAAVGFAS